MLKHAAHYHLTPFCPSVARSEETVSETYSWRG